MTSIWLFNTTEYLIRYCYNRFREIGGFSVEPTEPIESKERAILLFAGTLNPPTRAHAEMISDAAVHIKNKHNCSSFRAIISPVNPNYSKKSLHTKMLDSNPSIRIDLVKLWIKDVIAWYPTVFDQNNDIVLDDWEFSQPENVLTIDLIKHVKQMYPSSKIYFVCGADLAQTLSDPDIWTPEDVEEIKSLSTFLCTRRPGAPDPKDPEIELFDGHDSSVSSTQVRKFINQYPDTWVDILGLMTPLVRDSIKNDYPKLYLD